MIMDLDRIKVLLVEDNDKAMRLVKMVLQDMGITNIFTASDGYKALRFLDECEDLVNLIISDWNMPVMTGLELLAQVRSARPDMPFLMLTARSTLESVKHARERGVSAYLAKPFAPEALQQKIIALTSRIH